MPKTAVAISSSCLDDLRSDTRSVGLLLRLVDQNRGMRREQLRLIFETTQKPGAYRDSRRYRRTTTTQGTSAESVRHQKDFCSHPGRDQVRELLLCTHRNIARKA